MKRYGYNGLEVHEREHRGLLDKTFSLRENVYSSFEEVHKQALIDFLETDFMEHVVEDVKTWHEGNIDKEFVYQRLENIAVDSARS